MPRKRVLKTERNSIDEEAVKRAIMYYFNGTCSEREAARVNGIKRSTLQSRVKTILSKKTKQEYLRQHLQNQDDSGNDSELVDDSPKYSNKYTNRQVFTMEEEEELEKYIKKCSDINYGLTYVQVQKLAYDYANALPHCKVPREWHESKQAKEGWRRGFMERHKSLSLRKPESTSLSRSTAFNKFKVEQFFDNLKKVYDCYQFTAERIYNLDETGVTTVMKPVKVVTTTGKKQVSQAASAERGELVTFVGIVNAAGQSIPPVYVFPRVRNIDDFMHGAPISSLALGNKSGWMTAELFPNVLKHIVTHTHCTIAKPILLLIDNHESHVNLACVKFCKENGIVLLSFSPHTTHRLQPLDVAVYGPFKQFCSVAFNDWMTSNPGKTISVRNIAELTNRAYLRAFTASNIISGFKKPGIWPFNRLAFSDADFNSSFVTDMPLPQNNQLENENQIAVNNNPSTTKFEEAPEDENKEVLDNETKEAKEIQEKDRESREELLLEEEDDIPLNTLQDRIIQKNPKINILSVLTISPSCSGLSLAKKNQTVKITPEFVKPYPKAVRIEGKHKREPGLSRVYTDTPEKERLEEKEREKQRKKDKCPKRDLFSNNEPKKNVNRQPIKKVKLDQLNYPDSSSNNSDVLSFHNNSDEDVDEELKNIEELKTEKLNEGDFVLVKFKVRSAFIHFVGQILNITNENTTRVKFLRRKGLSKTFYFPSIDDITEIDINDVISKLVPSSKAGTARTASYYHFNYNFGFLVIN